MSDSSTNPRVGSLGVLSPGRSQRLAPAAAGSALVGGALVAGLALVSSLGGPVDLDDLTGGPIDQLHANVGGGVSDNDFDGDGLSDAQEEVLGLLPYLFDSDFDGFGDGEEIARQSDPFDEYSIPTSQGISASLTANGGSATNLRLVVVVHEPAGEKGQSKIRIGALTHDRSVAVPIERFMGISNVLTSPGSDGSTVTSIDIPIQSALVHTNEHVAFFLAAGSQLQASFNAAAKIDVLSTDGVLQLLRPLALNADSSGGTGSIRQPIPPAAEGPSIPSSWVPGAICVQSSVTVGGAGAVVDKLIVEAECLQGFDSYCAPSCSSSVGTTYRTINPGAFIGG